MSMSTYENDLPEGRLGARARVSWAAIFAGAVLAVSIQVLFSVLGAGVGLSFVNPGHADSASASSLGDGAGIWWLVSMVVSLIVGAYAAARLAGTASRFDGILHGLVVWAIAMLLTLYLITSTVGGLIGGVFSAVGGTMSAAGSVVGSAASAVGSGAKDAAPQISKATGIGPDALREQAQNLISSPTPQDPASMSKADAAKAIVEQLPDLVSGGSDTDAAKNRIINIVAAQANISPDEARARVNDAIDKAQAKKQQAIQAAKNAADASAAAASHASFLAFFGLLIGAIASVIGGAIASPRTVVGRRA